jgi:ArsR family transcriptional regulator
LADLLYNKDQIRSHYRDLLDERPQDYYERFDPEILEKRPLVAALLEKAFEANFPERTGKLLDVGCGTCFYYPFLSRHAEQVIGLDLSPAMLEQANELITLKGLENCEVREGNALDLPFEDGSLDCVHSWDFLHHCPEPARALAEIGRVLRPGGRYVVVEPNLINPSILWYHARRRAEWGLFSKNQFRIPRLLRKDFDIDLRYDNTIISFLNERTQGLWKAVDTFTSIPPFHFLRFRYMLSCTRKG